MTWPTRRRAGRRARALSCSLLLAAGLSGCDDEPECHISAVFMGALQGPAAWSPTGRDHCGFADTQALAQDTLAMAFVNEQSDVGESLYVMIEQSSIGPGGFAGRMIYTRAGQVWASYPGTCTVGLPDFEYEEWSLIDFVRFEGSVICPEPLVSTTPDNGELTMTNIEFGGHVHAEVLVYPFP
ncbi:hypothetical protein [Paraliomyxa miuraensis]|uniref:hypothetical protein n=1 Tax=Paraliomyxa miuraensis TaxID=376150 RepID=UPI0022537462|nr:hypothetical protein [Paraliomyxa miuraensis]MCX4243831.1 hypothetical protein [Paraliomyxa miuraensis]